MGSSTNNAREMREKPDKISRLSDLAHLPPNQYTVMNVLADPRELTYQALCNAVFALPEDKRLTQSELDSTLYELVKLGYVTSFFENGHLNYMMQLSPNQRPSKRDEQRLWNKFDMGLEALDINLDSLGVERLKTPSKPGTKRYEIPGMPASAPAQKTSSSPGLFKFDLESLLDNMKIDKPGEAPEKVVAGYAAGLQPASPASESLNVPASAASQPIWLMTRPLFHRLPLLRPHNWRASRRKSRP
jgi:hypothetical protein